MDPGESDTGSRTTNLYRGDADTSLEQGARCEWVGRMKFCAPRVERLGRIKKHLLKNLWFDDGALRSKLSRNITLGRYQGTRTPYRNRTGGVHLEPERGGPPIDTDWDPGTSAVQPWGSGSVAT